MFTKANCWLLLKNLQIENWSLSCQPWSLHCFQTLHYICDRFGCKIWMQSIQNHARHRIQAFARRVTMCAAIWSHCAVRFESEPPPFPRTGRQLRSAAQRLCTGFYSEQLVLILSYFYSETNERLPPTRKRPVFVLARPTRPSCAGARLPQERSHWFCSNNLRLSSWIAFESACQMTCRGSNLDSNLISAAEPPDQWVLEVLSAPKPPNKVQWICGVWILFRRPELRTAVSRYQPSSTRLTKIQLLIYPIETKILNNNKTDNRFVIITDEIDPDMLMDTNNYSVIRGKWI